MVDDSMIIRKIMSRYLDGTQATYHICSDGAEAIEWFNHNADICCCVITDLEMPKLGGDAVIRHVLSKDRDMPCYLVSGNDIPLDSLPRGTRRAIVKPITQDQVNEIIQEIFHSQSELKAKDNGNNMMSLTSFDVAELALGLDHSCGTPRRVVSDDNSRDAREEVTFRRHNREPSSNKLPSKDGGNSPRFMSDSSNKEEKDVKLRLPPILPTM